MAGIVEVAKKAGVSISTVSHVINGTKYVGEPLAQRVQLAIKELDYQVNDIAVSMKRQITNNIGVILPKITMIFFPEVLEGIEIAAKENGYRLFYFSTNYDFEKEQEYVNTLKSGWVDGIVLDSCCSMENMDEYQQKLLSTPSGRPIPIVSLENIFSSEEIGVVAINQVKYTKEAVEYLIKLGHKNIGLLLGPTYLQLSRDNIAGYKSALETLGLPFDERNIIYGDYLPESGYLAVKEALERGAGWTAMFVANDQMAIGAIKAAKSAGLRVPQDLAIIGADGIFVASLIEPSLTTVDLPKFEMGYKAVELLVKRIQGKPIESYHIYLDGKLIIRKSTDESVQEDWVLKGW